VGVTAAGDKMTVGVELCGTTVGGALVMIGAVGTVAAGCWDAPPNTKTLPKTMLTTTIDPAAKFIIFARDHFLERPFGRRDFFGITPSCRTSSLTDYSTIPFFASRGWRRLRTDAIQATGPVPLDIHLSAVRFSQTVTRQLPQTAVVEARHSLWRL
jgi:hypothetical protein